MVLTRYNRKIPLHSINVETRNVWLRYLVPRVQFHLLLISPSPFYQFRLLFIFINSPFSSKFYSYFSFLFIFCSFSFLSLPSLRISEKFLFYEVKYQFMVPTRYSSNIFLHSINVETRNVRLRYLVPRDQFHFLLIFINFAFSFYQFLFYSKFINSSTSLFLSIPPLPYFYQFLHLLIFINSSSSLFLLIPPPPY